MIGILINKQAKTSLHSKLSIYKSLIKPMWTYGIELWVTVKMLNVNKIQTIQPKILRRLLN